MPLPAEAVRATAAIASCLRGQGAICKVYQPGADDKDSALLLSSVSGGIRLKVGDVIRVAALEEALKTQAAAIREDDRVLLRTGNGQP